MTRKWNIPLTYQPKIGPVTSGECNQTIRPGRKFAVGDLIRFYTWKGRPYWSKRETITEYMPIIIAGNIIIQEWGLENPYNPLEHFPWEELDDLAAHDGIVPPTGEALRDVLISKNGKIPASGVEAQIVRWKP